MIRSLYGIKDSKIGKFLNITVSENDGVAVRDFSIGITAMRNDKSFIGQDKDYDLFTLGTFDDVTGFITRYEEPFYIMNGSQVVKGDD